MPFEIFKQSERQLSTEEILNITKKESAQARYYLVMADRIASSHPILARQVYDATKYRFETLGASLTTKNLSYDKWQAACYYPNHRSDRSEDMWEMKLLSLARSSHAPSLNPFYIAQDISIGRIHKDPTVQEPISCFLSPQPPSGSLASLLSHSDWIKNFQMNLGPTIETMAQGHKQITVATNIYSALLDGGVMTNMIREVQPSLSVQQLYMHSSPAKLLDPQISISPVESAHLDEVIQQKNPTLFVDHFSSSGAALVSYLEFAAAHKIPPFAFIGMNMVDEYTLESIIDRYPIDIDVMELENTSLQSLLITPSDN